MNTQNCLEILSLYIGFWILGSIITHLIVFLYLHEIWGCSFGEAILLHIRDLFVGRNLFGIIVSVLRILVMLPFLVMAVFGFIIWIIACLICFLYELGFRE